MTKRPRSIPIAALALALAGCYTPPRYVPGPQPNLADYEARENCLYKQTAASIETYRAKKLDPELYVESISMLATLQCSAHIWTKMQRGTSNPSVQATRDEIEQEQIDRLETQQHATQVAIRQIRSLPPQTPR